MLRRQILTFIVISSITIHSFQSKYKQLFLPISRGARRELTASQEQAFDIFSGCIGWIDYQPLMFHRPDNSIRSCSCSRRVSCVCSIEFYSSFLSFYFLLDYSTDV